MQSEDEEIIRRCLLGDHDAFEELVEKYTPAIYRFSARLAGKENAQDISQEVFFKAWKHLKKFKSEKASLKTWLFAIARNACTDFLRKKRTPAISELGEEVDALDNIPDEELLPDSALMKLEDKAMLMETLEKLPADYQSILTLYYQENMNFREIGEITGKPLNTVKSSHRRAIIALRKLLS